MDNVTSEEFDYITQDYLSNFILGAGSRVPKNDSGSATLQSQKLVVPKEERRSLNTNVNGEEAPAQNPTDVLEVGILVKVQSNLFFTKQNLDFKFTEQLLRPDYESALRSSNGTSYFAFASVTDEKPIPIITPKPAPETKVPPKPRGVAGAVTLSIFLTLLAVGTAAGGFIWRRRRQQTLMKQQSLDQDGGDGLYSSPPLSGSSAYERDLENGDTNEDSNNAEKQQQQQKQQHPLKPHNTTTTTNNNINSKNTNMNLNIISTCNNTENVTELTPRLRPLETSSHHQGGPMLHSTTTTSTCKEGAAGFTFNMAVMTNMDSMSRASSQSSVHFSDVKLAYDQQYNRHQMLMHEMYGDIPPMIVIEALDDTVSDSVPTTPNNRLMLEDGTEQNAPASVESRALVPIMRQLPDSESHLGDIMK
jgi:hypothetical protein